MLLKNTFQRVADYFVKKEALLIPFFLLISFNRAYHIFRQGYMLGNFYVNYLDPIIHITDAAVLLMLLGLIILIGINRFINAKELKVFLALLLLFSAIQLLIFPNLVSIYFLTRFVIYLVTGYLFAFCLRKDFLDRSYIYRLTKPLLCLSAIFQSILAFLQFYNTRMIGLHFLGESRLNVGGFNTSGIFLPSGYFLRGYGTFPHPNILGGFLVIVLIFILSSFNENRSDISSFAKSLFKKENIMSSISIPIVLIGIFVTWSRVAWIATLFVLIVWLGQRAYLANKKVFAIYLSVLVVLFISSFLWIYSSTNSIAQSLKERLFVQSGGLDISMLERKVLFERALTFFKESPFLGGGFGSFLVKLGENPIYLRSGIKLMQPVHNIFMLLLAEVGLIGSLLLAFPIGQLLYLLKPYMKRFAFVAIAFYVLIAGNFDHYLFTLPQGLGMLFIMLPLVVMKKDS